MILFIYMKHEISGFVNIRHVKAIEEEKKCENVSQTFTQITLTMTI